MAEGTIKNVGDNLKNVRENFENYGANFSFVGENVLNPPMNSAISSNLGGKSHFLMR